MSRAALILLLVAVTAQLHGSFGQSWMALGTVGSTSAYDVDLAFNSGTPTIAFTDNSSHSVRVLAYSEGVWADVGPQDITANSDVSLAFDDNWNTFISFVDQGLDYVPKTVRVLTSDGPGALWYDVGFTSATSYGSVVAFDNGTLYMAAFEPTTFGVAVKTYTGGPVWMELGINAESCWSAISIAFNNAVPVIAFMENGTQYARAMTYSSESQQWMDIGYLTEQVMIACDVNLAVDSSGIVYLSFAENNTQNVRVMKYSALGDWLDVEDIGAQSASDVTLAVSGDVLYVAFSDYTNHNLRVMAFLNGSWVDVGHSSLSARSIVNMAFDDEGVLYVAFVDDTTLAVHVLSYSSTAPAPS